MWAYQKHHRWNCNEWEILKGLNKIKTIKDGNIAQENQDYNDIAVPSLEKQKCFLVPYRISAAGGDFLRISVSWSGTKQ